jgi:hypothetical protein
MISTGLFDQIQDIIYIYIYIHTYIHTYIYTYIHNGLRNAINRIDFLNISISCNKYGYMFSLVKPQSLSYVEEST